LKRHVDDEREMRVSVTTEQVDYAVVWAVFAVYNRSSFAILESNPDITYDYNSMKLFSLDSTVSSSTISSSGYSSKLIFPSNAFR